MKAGLTSSIGIYHLRSIAEGNVRGYDADAFRLVGKLRKNFPTQPHDPFSVHGSS